MAFLRELLMGTELKLRKSGAIVVVGCFVVQSFFAIVQGGTDLQSMVESDWEAQEKRKGLTMYAPAAVRAAFASAERAFSSSRLICAIAFSSYSSNSSWE